MAILFSKARIHPQIVTAFVNEREESVCMAWRLHWGARKYSC